MPKKQKFIQEHRQQNKAVNLPLCIVCEYKPKAVTRFGYA